MEIRQANEEDIPAIVELLKLSLGESLMPKSETFWRWKHLDNPFGQSPVLLAEEGGQLIGVRAFMRWEWRQGDTLYKAVRAVDTATHPKYQGKGIFKKLTMVLAEQCQREGVDFIFNTPNASSKPGYLKMGWTELGRLKLFIRPIIRISTKISTDFEANYRWVTERSEALQFKPPSDLLVTNYIPGFFRWRYGNNPNVHYYLASDEEKKSVIIFRLKPHRFGLELRIVDFIVHNSVFEKRHYTLLAELINSSGARLVTVAGGYIPNGFVPMKVGPVVTVRKLALDKPLSFGVWKPTLGDLEVF